ncbi:MAG: hypothetical protein COB20_09895 [SAR86 cluster bacterium]|uniref:ABC transporter permease n=1 Tax=SAR86 cluster bacterium TaxID=2030880 RepID=A0A2A4X3X1_9GAMM|nr:MAG: hypothetical protein COB20_09895 [SAR86 cluster bacterium]
MLNDLIFSFRLLRKNLSFSITSLIVITLGLTVSLCVYSILYEFRKSPPFPEGERYAVVKVFDQISGSEINITELSGYAYHSLKTQAESFEEFGIFSYSNDTVVFGEGMRPIKRVGIAPNLMAMTRAAPLLGRGFVEADATLNSQPVAIISYQLWQSFFSGNDAIIGQQASIANIPHIIIGVMPEKFSYPLSQDVWVPLNVSESDILPEGSLYWLIGKLKPSATLESSAVELNVALQTLAAEFPQEFSQWEFGVSGFSAIKAQGVGNTGALFNSVAMVIFLLASLNLSAILFSRANERRQELAVRNALGASAWQLRVQVLLESALLCIVGCLLAILLSALILQWVQLMTESVMATLGTFISFEFRIHGSGLFYAVCATFFIWIISSAATIYRIGDENVFHAMESGSHGASQKARGLASKVLIGVETVVSCFLLILCGLFTYSIVSAYQTDFGTRVDQLYTGNVSLMPVDYESADSQIAYLEELKRELLIEPEIENVSFASALPGGWGLGLRTAQYALEDRDLEVEGRYPEVDMVMITPDYFTDLDIQVVQGRSFNDLDNLAAPNVAIVNELFVQQHWPNENPLGKRIQLDPESGAEEITVVGISEHIIHGQAVGEGLEQPTLYRPLIQNPVRAVGLVASTARDLDVSELTAVMNNAAARVDRRVAIVGVFSLYDHQRMGLSGLNIIGRIMSGFALFTLALAVIGIYGIVSRSVFLRAAEIGIRRAVGSSDVEVIAIFIKQGLRYLATGIVIGSGLSLLVSNVMVQVFPDILDGIPIVITTVLLLLGALILLASYVPARKLVLLEPADALHYE